MPLLKKIMSSQDISEAMAYERVEPFGDRRADMRAALIACTVANKERRTPLKMSDFMLNFDKPKKPTVKKQVMEVFGKWLQ